MKTAEASGRIANQHTPTVAVIIPAYRCASTIENVVSCIPAWVSQIIVVDDCSPDSTSQVLVRLNDPRLHLVRHPKNQGVGGAVLTGYQEAVKCGADIVVKMDSDGQMDPDYLPLLVKPIISQKADYTKGNRFLHGREIKAMPWVRRMGNLGLSFLTKLASGYWNIFDPTNGYTAISAEVIPLLNLDRIDRRYFFEISILVELGLQRAVVKDISIPAVYRNETSSLSERKTLFQFPPKLFGGLLRRIIISYFIRDFTAMTLFLTTGIPLVIFGAVWGIVEWTRSAMTGIVTTTGTIMISVLPLILGIQLLLQAIVMDIQNVPTEVIHGRDTGLEFSSVLH